MGQTSTTEQKTAADAEAWHTLTVDESFERLGSSAAGLSLEEASRRLEEVGPNELEEREQEPRWLMFIRQFNDIMIWVLLVAVGISALQGEYIDALAITAILVLNAVLGFVQEFRAQKALDALKELSAPTARVVRAGAESEIPARELVPGDIIVLEAGDRVPADGRLVEAVTLRVIEAELTGESSPSAKTAEAVGDPAAPIGDRDDMVFSGTSVARGRGRSVITTTGDDTEMGRIADLLSRTEDELTPLQKELNVVGKRIAILVLAIAAIVFFEEVALLITRSGEGIVEAFGDEAFRQGVAGGLLVAVSLAVAAIPEGLPAIVTVALSLGVRRMAEHNAIVRRLHAVETLGSTTFICSDKTGTLTRNKMAVRRLVVGQEAADVEPDWGLAPAERTPHREDLELLMAIATSANDARFGADGELIGDPTETALVEASQHLTPGHLHPRRIGEVPFDSERKRMTTVHSLEGKRVAFTKGGADVVLALSTRALLRGEIVPMTDALREDLSEKNAELAADGYRTLAFATRELDDDEPNEGEQIERDLTYVGIMGLLDPPRTEVEDALVECRRAGITVAMVTGDHALTAQAVSRQIGLLPHEAPPEATVTGVELERMTDEELASRVEEIRVYARVDPEHKLRIVTALQANGEIVAMTGDGVNDAPALKKADIGVAMGQVGTDVSREAADMVLADDNFATIVEAVHEGRVVFDNLRKVILFLLSCNMSEVLVVFLTALISPQTALIPLQLLWINLVTDGLPALALGVDLGDPNIMDRPPRSAKESILTPRRQLQVLWQGSIITAAVLVLYYWVAPVLLGAGDAKARTMIFTGLVLTQLLHAFDFRSESRSVFRLDSLRNRWLVLGLIGSMALQALVIYLPLFQGVFRTVPLGAADWTAIVVTALVAVGIIDAVKVLVTRRTIAEASAT
jgi:Ca2+-transporting ATPase